MKGTKTHQGRVVAIDGHTTAWLRARRSDAQAKALHAGVPFRRDGYVCGSVPGGGVPLRPGTLTQAWGRARVRAGVPGVLLKNLRHWSASTLIAAGEDPSVVTARLGHADGTTARRFYIAAMSEAEDRAAATLGAMLTELA